MRFVAAEKGSLRDVSTSKPHEHCSTLHILQRKSGINSTNPTLIAQSTIILSQVASGVVHYSEIVAQSAV